jgi:hypothetical protein
VLGIILSLLMLSNSGSVQAESSGQILGYEFNIYNADYLPEHDPSIARLVADMSVEEAVQILQRELVGAQFFGLDGVKVENTSSAEPTPESAAVQTLVVDRPGLSWRFMLQHEEGVLASFAFDDAVQVWTRFSMAKKSTDSDPPTVSPQGVVLYILTHDGVEDVMENAIALSKILPSYPGRLPSYSTGQSLARPGLFVREGSPGGFAVCCFSSTGFGHGEEPDIPLERLPLVIAAFQRLSPNLETPESRLLLVVPLAKPTNEEVETIIAFCNRGGFDNQGVFLCQHNQLHGLAYMKSHAHGSMSNLVDQCALKWVGDYRQQAECVTYDMMIMSDPPDDHE